VLGTKGEESCMLVWSLVAPSRDVCQYVSVGWMGGRRVARVFHCVISSCMNYVWGISLVMEDMPGGRR
jgi:hypothetical protein